MSEQKRVRGRSKKKKHTKETDNVSEVFFGTSSGEIAEEEEEEDQEQNIGAGTVQIDYESLSRTLAMEVEKLTADCESESRTFQNKLKRLKKNATDHISKAEINYASLLKDQKEMIHKLEIQSTSNKQKFRSCKAQMQPMQSWIDNSEVKLYNRFKKIVVRVESEVKNEEENDFTHKSGAGIVINSKGHILTSAHNVGKVCRNLLVSYFKTEFIKGDGIFVEAKVSKIRFEYDLAILKPKVERTHSIWAKMSEKSEVRIATDVFSITHPSDLYYSYYSGSIACGLRTIKDLLSKSNEDEKKKLKTYHKELKLFQINGFDSDICSRGGPVFDCVGDVIGLIAFDYGSQDYAVHLEELQSFLCDYEDDKLKDKMILEKTTNYHKKKSSRQGRLLPL